jgi:hypothetical protein
MMAVEKHKIDGGVLTKDIPEEILKSTGAYGHPMQPECCAVPMSQGCQRLCPF